jgi:hypothetical protein
MHQWLHDSAAAPRFVLVAPAGRGKSALLVHWLQRLRADGTLNDWSLAFVPISIRFNTNRPETFLEAIAARLADILGRALRPAHSDPVAFYEDQCRVLLGEVVERQIPVLLVIDGVDEALGGSFSSFWYPRRPGPRLRMVVSARLQVGDVDAQGWVGRLGWGGGTRVTTHDLPPLEAHGIRHLLVSTGAPVDVLAARPEIVDRLLDLSGGEPLILRLYVEDLWRQGPHTSELTIDDLDHIKPGFRGYFDDWFQRQRKAWSLERAQGAEIVEADVLAYLLVLAGTFGPLSSGELAELAQRACGLASRMRMADALHPLRRFIIGTGRPSDDDMTGYVLAHPKFGEFLREEFFEPDEVARVHRCIVSVTPAFGTRARPSRWLCTLCLPCRPDAIPVLQMVSDVFFDWTRSPVDGPISRHTDQNRYAQPRSPMDMMVTGPDRPADGFAWFSAASNPARLCRRCRHPLWSGNVALEVWTDAPRLVSSTIAQTNCLALNWGRGGKSGWRAGPQAGSAFQNMTKAWTLRQTIDALIGSGNHNRRRTA